MTGIPAMIDDLTPAEVAEKTVAVGIKKVNLDFLTMFFLALLGGAYIALGAIFATTVATNGPQFPYGVNTFLKGIAFTLGLILVLVAGAELFTGNNLIFMAFLAKKVSLAKMLRNWSVVYLGNLLGSLLIAFIMVLSKQYLSANGALGKTALSIADSKAGLAFLPALCLGIMCNLLVCLAVWLSYSARTTAGKILSIIPPISAFVAAGFEHSVANMYFIPIGLFIQWADPAFAAGAGQFSHLSLANFFLRNLLPVTLGNVIGGALFVSLVYWFIYLRHKN